jgi:hypothetical protein
MIRYVATILVAILLSAPLVAGITPFPASFYAQMVPTNGTSLYVRVGGQGPAVVLLHGFGDTGDMWAPLAIVLAKDHTVIVPDLRGMGMSDHPDTLSQVTPAYAECKCRIEQISPVPCALDSYAIRRALGPKYSRRIRSTCSCRVVSMFFLASSKPLPRTITDNLSQTPLQPSSSGQKLQSRGTPAITGRVTACDFIGTPSTFKSPSHWMAPGYSRHSEK